MDKKFDTVLKEEVKQIIKDYLQENLSVILETSPPGWVDDCHTITVKISIDGEIIDSSSDTIYVPS